MKLPLVSTVSRRGFLITLVGAAPLVTQGRADEAPTGSGFEFEPDQPLIPAPDSPTDWPAFQRALDEWRREETRRLDYDDALYCRPEMAWAARCFCCGFVLVYDERFYDPRRQEYRVEGLVEHALRDFGGYDAVVLWPGYPQLGLDARNQFDYYRNLPGGILGLKKVVARFHARGVRVFIDYNPWDTGTRRELRSDTEVLATLVQALGVDGIFLDTMDQGSESLRARLDATRPGVVLESELALPLDRVGDHHLSWAQWFRDRHVPGVLRNKWFERRHLQHQIRRWDLDHTGELHTAWMNGSGLMVWENVFGSWVGWCPRDRSFLRQMLPAQRQFADLFTAGRWTPLVPTLHPEVYASRWEGAGQRLWTLVNRSDQPVEGPLMTLTPPPAGDLYDVLSGRHARRERLPGGDQVWWGRIEARGLGGLLEVPNGQELEGFLRQQRECSSRMDRETTTELRVTRLSGVQATRRVRTVPPDMVAIPAAAFTLRSTMRLRECGFYESVPSPRHRLASSYEYAVETFERRVVIEPYAIDATPVTNAQFLKFLREGGYRPDAPDGFLKHWGHGRPPKGEEEHPVVYVSLEDARAYAAWAGKRLPLEEEWQYAAQGAEGLRYPWGPTLEADRCNDGRAGPGTTPVRAYPQGRSPFGVWDLCGNVWEWTESERNDGRTRFCLLKGGTWYRAEGSGWYFEGGPQPNPHAAKCLLMAPGLDRCATVGFRCVVDRRVT